MIKQCAIAIAFLLPMVAQASCRWQWVDHDYNPLTPAIQQQVCSRATDAPVIRPIEIRPLQTPQIRPIQPFVIPPIGTTRCRVQSVFEGGRWVDRQICR